MIVVCVASGPSLTAADVSYCYQRAKVCVVNDNYRIAPWADWLYAADHRWWVSVPIGFQHPNWELSRQMFKGERVTCDPGTADKFGLRYIPHQPGKGLGVAPIVQGSLSGTEAINFMANEGATKIVLLGYDMDGPAHWFGPHPDTVTVETPSGPLVEAMNSATEKDYEFCREELRFMAEDLKARGIEVINCSRKTMLNCFPVRALQEVL